ncbi:conserved hypothetical protein [Ricinus communis]|uniref:DUF223 domain-containing protein n=1 Tax=Ricinus communis TaxID=3988 RepID=B9T6G6_RICCO|nr:conserved hypothetical protein [Ricinus communis]
MPYTLLSEVNSGCKNVRMTVRIARMWEFVNVSNPDDLFSVEVAKGRKYISYIIPAQLNYKISNHAFRIRLSRSTFVKSIEDDSVIPFDRFDFIDFEAVRVRIEDETLLTDVFEK